MAALALVGAIVTGCSSDDNFTDEPQQPEQKSNVVTVRTTLSLGGSDATTRALNPTTGEKTFAVGDKISVSYQQTNDDMIEALSEELQLGDISVDGKTATFTVTLDDPKDGGTVYYGYPGVDGGADFYSGQDGSFETFESNFDRASSEESTMTVSGSNVTLPSLTLENDNAVLVLTLKDADGSNTITSGLRQVTITTVDDRELTYTITAKGGGTFGTDKIYVAIASTNKATITVTATNGTDNYTKTLTDKTYTEGNIYNLGWRMTKQHPVGALAGRFTINESGDKVFFSQGNLQATYDGSTWSWAFAEHQWDYIGNAAGNTSISGDGTVSANNVTVDLFGWVGASNTAWSGDLGTTGNAAMHGISNSTTLNSTNTYGNNKTDALKSDWGTTIGTGWRTMTNDEWYYLFNTRSGATVSGNATIRYTYATINTDVNDGVNGIILFPDGETFAEGEATWGSLNIHSNWTTKCTSAQWTALAAKGCVFLPAAGSRDGATVSDVGSQGYYWTSSYSTSAENAKLLFFWTNLNPALGWAERYRGNSVRLVREVE